MTLNYQFLILMSRHSNVLTSGMQEWSFKDRIKTVNFNTFEQYCTTLQENKHKQNGELSTKSQQIRDKFCFIDEFSHWSLRIESSVIGDITNVYSLFIIIIIIFMSL